MSVCENMISGNLFERMVYGGIINLQEHMQVVNDLNVFPIPDGDTGTNMFLTLKGGVDRLKQTAEEGIDKKSDALAKGMLLGARGNSGVILSQLFFGIAEGLKDKSSVSVTEFGVALENGVKCAYGAVASPVEGTVLTVAREAAEHSVKTATQSTNVISFFEGYLSEMRRSLEKTPDLLSVLKEAGVIDSGGAGLVYIAEGFVKALGGAISPAEYQEEITTQSTVDLSRFNEDSEMIYGYCTELLLQLQRVKTDVDAFSVSDLIAFLETVGDSIVAFKTDSVVKIHVHTMTPYVVLAHCHQYGEFLTVKIENMTLQHNEVIGNTTTERIKPAKQSHKEYALVTVASGSGLIRVFEESGADYVINGGQTNNPSAEDFIEAFDTVNADHIFVLPNNGNIILAANQAAEIYKNAKIYVIPSKSIGQGYSALSMLDYSSQDPEKIVESLCEQIIGVTTGMITRAVRTTTVNGVEINEGDYIGFTDKIMQVSKPSKVETAKRLIDKAICDKSYLIAVYGCDATKEEREELAVYINHSHSTIEFYEIEGEQEVYDFLFITE